MNTSRFDPPQEEAYFAKKGVSNSYLGEYLRQASGLPEPNFRHARRLGKALHWLILEPERFNMRNYTGAERVNLMNMARAIREQSTIPIDYTQQHEVEVEFVLMGYLAKSKIDILDDNRKFIADIKTTAARSYDEFEEFILEYQYQRQGAFYLDVPQVHAAGIDRFIMIAVTKKKPFRVFEYVITRGDTMYKSGRAMISSVMTMIKNDKAEGHLRVD